MRISNSLKSKLLAAAVIIVLIAAMIAIVFFVFYKTFTPDFKDIIDEKCEVYHVDKLLVYAVIKTESNYDVDALSQKGAVGLMQIMPGTASWLTGEAITPDMLSDPRVNIDIGVGYLYKLTIKYKEMKYVLAAYNAGEGRVDEWLKKGVDFDNLPYKETKNYLKKIKIYKSLYDILW